VPLASSINLPPGAVKRAEAATRELASEYLDQIAARVQEKDFSITTVTVPGRPHEEIVRFAETEQVDIIVMCTRGHSGVSRWLIGSVADRITRSVNVPILLVRSPKDSRDTK